MKIFKKFGRLTSFVAILSLITHMFIGVMPVFAVSTGGPPTITSSGGFPVTVNSNPVTPSDFSYTVDNTGGPDFNELNYFIQIQNISNPSELKSFNFVDGFGNVTDLKPFLTQQGTSLEFNSLILGDFNHPVLDSNGLVQSTALDKFGNPVLEPLLTADEVIVRTFQISFVSSTVKQFPLFISVQDKAPDINGIIQAGNLATNDDAVFNVVADSTAPTATVAHNETNKTITYTFSEPVVLRDALGNILQSSTYASSLAVYDRDTYLAHNLGDPEPAHVAGIAISSAVLSADGQTMNITYTGSLIKNVDSYYIVDAWGKNITDLVGNKMVQDPSQIFMVVGDTTHPTATVAHNETNKTITYSFNEPVQLLDSSNIVISPTDYASKLGIYNLADYAAHVPGTPAPATNGGTITSAVLSTDGKTMVITYDGSLITMTDTTYIVDAWGYNITDLVGNKMLPDAQTQSFTVVGDSIPPTATVAHNETNKTITYTFSEPVVLRDAFGVILPSTTYASSLAIYDRDTYLAHNLFDPEPAHVAGVTITSAVLSIDGQTMAITYTGSLIKNVDSYYIVDAWGKNITDLVGNKMVQSASQIFMVAGDMSAPVLTRLGSSPVQVTVGTAYTDAGATATDKVDGNLTSNIVTTGTVDTSKVGSYTVTYSVTDSAGHTVSTTRIVNVVAAEAPATTSSTTGSGTGTADGATSTPTSDTTTVADTGTGTPEVKGTSTTNNNTDKKSDPGFFGSTWMGVYTWIWLLGGAAAIGGGAWWLFGARRQD